MPAGMSYDQLFRVPFIMGLIRRYHAPGNTLSAYYGLGITGRVAQRITGRAGQFDIFDGTRSLLPASVPYAPPTRMNRKPVGTLPITVPRQYVALGIEDEKIFATRPLGVNSSAPVDSGGRQYFANQIQYLRTRFNNTQEYLTAKMVAGGWGMKEAATGSQILHFVDKGTSGAVDVDMKIPSGNTGNVGGIFSSLWSTLSTDINAQLMQLNVLAARQNGRTIRDIWINGNTARYLFNNTSMQAQGGSVFRIFDTLNPAREIGPDQKFPDTGVTVQFRALPNFLFHVYNQGYVTPGTAEDFTSQTASANWNYFIPDGKAIMTPSPGEWCGMVEGSEPIQWSLNDRGSQVVYGFGMGFERAIDPPRTDVKMVYNGCPVITEPAAVYYVTVL